MEIFLILLVIVLTVITVRLYCILIRRRVERDSLAEKYVKERKSLREGLDSERRDLLDCLVDEVLFFDSRERLLFYNAAVKNLFQGRKLQGVMANELFYEGSVTQGIRECLISGQSYSEELAIRELTNVMGIKDFRRDSVCRLEVAPAKLAGSEESVCVIIRDVTADVEADQVRRDFVANASHELRTPMAIIGGYLENLSEEGALDDTVMVKKFITIMQKHSLRISQIVEDMLSISQLESAGEDSMNSEPFVFLECVEDVSERLSALISTNDIHFQTQIEPIDLEILGDRFYWTQILFNLIENAIKQNPQKKNLKITVSAKEVERELCIFVADNGKGIPVGDIPFVFKRFYRVDKHHSNSAIKGTGLGLSIVRRAVEAHGGNISLQSTPGVETKFLIQLPFP